MLPERTRRILTTHVGSLIRPDDFVAVLEKKEAGEPYDQATYAAGSAGTHRTPATCR